jgi:LysM repeat protein
MPVALPALPVAAVALTQQSRPAPHGWVRYRVREGDTIFDLATAHRTSMSALVAANHLSGRAGRIRTGQVLLVPPTAHQVPVAVRPAYVTRVVRSGDTISDLAAAYRISPSVLLQANHLDRRGRIYAGQHLRVPAAAARAVAKRRTPTPSRQSYRVHAGDTVGLLALRFHTTQAAIRKANRLGSLGLIRAGQTLQIPGSARPASSSANSFAGRTYPNATVRAAAHDRALLARRRVPSRTATRELVVRTARRYGVDPSLVLAVSWQESGWNQRQVSVADAIGVMQVVPSTGEWASTLVGRRLDLLDPADNVTAGVVVLHALLRSTTTARAVAGYYQGLGSVQTHGMFADTKAYVRSVLALRARFD